MLWFEVWECLTGGRTPSLTAFQRKYIVRLRQRASAITALKARRSVRISEGKYSPKQCSKWLSRDLGDEIYPQAAKYFELFYDRNFQKQVRPFSVKQGMATAGNYFVEGAKIPITKNRNYRYARYRRIVEAELSKKSGGTNYEEFIFVLYAKVRLNAFQPSELDALRKIYEFAVRVKMSFRAVKRSDRRTATFMTSSYNEFCDWYSRIEDEYSCKQRFFVPLFCRYWEERGVIYSPQKIDELLRYDVYPQCFAEQDWKNLGINRKKFLDVIGKIRITSKKK